MINVTRKEDQEIVESALEAAREEHDEPDAVRTAAITEVCAAYIGYEGRLQEEA